MRTYYRATGGIDGAIQTLLFWAVILTAPVWLPILAIVVAWEALFPKKHETVPVPPPRPAYVAPAPVYTTNPRPSPAASAPVFKTPAKPPAKAALVEEPGTPICRAYRKLEQKGIADIAAGYPGMGGHNLKLAQAKLIEHGC